MRRKLLKLGNYLKSIKCYKELDYLIKISNIETPSISGARCIPLNEWGGIPDGFKVFTHSSTKSIDTFDTMLDGGFRVAKTGLGSLSITFLEEGAKALSESLRRRVHPDNKLYNLGSMVVIAAINPELLVADGLEDSVLDLYKSGEGDMLGPVFIRNVKVIEEFEEGHNWSDNAWKMPSRFLYAAYNGLNDTICINPDWDGSRPTEYGKRLDRNKKEFLSLSESSSGDLKNNIVSTNLFEGSEDDFDIF